MYDGLQDDAKTRELRDGRNSHGDTAVGRLRFVFAVLHVPGRARERLLHAFGPVQGYCAQAFRSQRL
jgi:hypothetical protein